MTPKRREREKLFKKEVLKEVREGAREVQRSSFLFVQHEDLPEEDVPAEEETTGE